MYLSHIYRISITYFFIQIDLVYDLCELRPVYSPKEKRSLHLCTQFSLLILPTRLRGHPGRPRSPDF